MKNAIPTAVVIFFSLLSTLNAEAEELRYEFIAIAAPDVRSCATALNNRGQVVGQLTTTDSSGGSISRGFLFEDGELTLLRGLMDDSSMVESINDRGQIAGSSIAPADTYTVEAMVIDHGVIKGLGQLVPGGRMSQAFAINDRGQIVGIARSTPGGGDGPYRAFLWEQGVMSDLGSLGGENSFARGINNRGEVVGLSIDEGRAFYFRCAGRTLHTSDLHWHGWKRRARENSPPRRR